MEYATIIMMLALIQCMFFSMQVGAARAKDGIDAPATTGNEHFERVFRVHQNTIEQLILFIPAIYAFSAYVSPIWGAGIGVVYLIGRFIYSNNYVQDPKKRGPGMMLTMLPNAILILGGLIGATLQLF